MRNTVQASQSGKFPPDHDGISGEPLLQRETHQAIEHAYRQADTHGAERAHTLDAFARSVEQILKLPQEHRANYALPLVEGYVRAHGEPGLRRMIDEVRKISNRNQSAVDQIDGMIDKAISQNPQAKTLLREDLGITFFREESGIDLVVMALARDSGVDVPLNLWGRGNHVVDKAADGAVSAFSLHVERMAAKSLSGAPATREDQNKQMNLLKLHKMYTGLSENRNWDTLKRLMRDG